MSSPATVTRQIFDGYEAQVYTAPAPDAAGQLRPIFWRQVFPLDVAGTYSIINLHKGQSVLLDVQATVSLTNAAGTAIGSFVSGQFVELVATSDSGDFRYRVFASDIPNAKFTTSAAASGVVPAAADWTGARLVIWQNTTDGAMAVTTATGAELQAALAAYGLPTTYVYILRIANRGDNTITITGGDDVTIVGEATIATLVTRDYLVTVSPSGTSMRSVSKGTIET